MKTKILFLAALALCLIFCSCLLPESFTCNINIYADGSYSLRYEGTMVLYDVLREMSGKTIVDPAKDRMFEQLYAATEADTNFSQFKYLGNGRAQGIYEKSVKDKSPLSFYGDFPSISISTVEGGIIAIRETGMDSVNKNQLKALGYQIQGTVIITSELEPLKNIGLPFEKRGNLYVIRQEIRNIPDSDILILFQK